MQTDGAEKPFAAEGVVTEGVAPLLHEVVGVLVDRRVALVGIGVGRVARVAQGEGGPADEEQGESREQREDGKSARSWHMGVTPEEADAAHTSAFLQKVKH